MYRYHSKAIECHLNYVYHDTWNITICLMLYMYMMLITGEAYEAYPITLLIVALSHLVIF